MTEKNETPRQLTLTDQLWVFGRSGWEQAAWNYPRLQNLGFCYLMIPAIRRLYPDKTEAGQAAARHLELFNTMPYMQSLITGVTLSLEEDRANGKPVSAADISAVKIGMMGSLAGVADPIWWGTWRPILSAFAASLALSGFGIVGPLVFFIGWNLARLAFRWGAQRWGYRQGLKVVTALSSGVLQKLTLGASIVGMFVMGAIIPRWTRVKLAPIVATNHHAVLSLQSLMDQLLPGLIPLLLTLGCVWLLRRHVKPLWLLLGLFILGLAGYSLGILR
ncbi:MAG: PTS system mannose/fructose/sorbose family transporter subunit IID [Levilactobacillus sp.]|jgi:PTS system mannose-specific IID component|uniref:PTS system mannose/fructose/sorbose family transporter subunit IID n=1 Tax=Levilactobacillus sp. TaxID=2767919 RepID=UPI002583A9DE|nr:PTS system mannose/fructose/sorbose family transporter subunit IID [Levilactobacillus sp.]MCH4124125.1 PTS system mannose/fructose/sorbose family transporter subunit IID [Levilactobacillus sp.]MCI1554039.1 PTS system mannose/fructose/sorbose family transporter subunit IID [Levilactobacillus sp.]MCI1598431.1 PTS system mannose/fructose/sorbose family transporter subunit IID [Levilactobacillus sp.]MCI1605800.1 PTS system mannose/fructose/sorbose family transporter subunit IID [Levilactobacillu